MVTLLVVVLALCVVVAVVGAPLHRAAGTDGAGDNPAESPDRSEGESAERELEAERDAKLREIRDAELDWRTGKLSERDWQVLDAQLRSEAAELLKAESAQRGDRTPDR